MFDRVQADLLEPEPVEAAIKISGAKRAFIYYAHGSPDDIRRQSWRGICKVLE